MKIRKNRQKTCDFVNDCMKFARRFEHIPADPRNPELAPAKIFEDAAHRAKLLHEMPLSEVIASHEDDLFFAICYVYGWAARLNSLSDAQLSDALDAYAWFMETFEHQPAADSPEAYITMAVIEKCRAAPGWQQRARAIVRRAHMEIRGSDRGPRPAILSAPTSTVIDVDFKARRRVSA